MLGSHETFKLTLAAKGPLWSRESLVTGVSFWTIDTRSTWLSGERGGGEGIGSGRGVHYHSAETS